MLQHECMLQQECNEMLQHECMLQQECNEMLQHECIDACTFKDPCL